MTDYIDKIAEIFIKEIEAINNYDHNTEVAQLIREIINEEKPTESEILNSNQLTNLIITDEVEDILYEIAIELSSDYKEILFIHNVLNIDFLEHVASEIRSNHVYFKLLNRVKRKEKRDLQTLKTYIKALETVKAITLNLNLKNEIEKEISFYSNINKTFLKSKGFIYEISKPHLTKQKANKFEIFIKGKINQLTTSQTNY